MKKVRPNMTYYKAILLLETNVFDMAQLIKQCMDFHCC